MDLHARLMEEIKGRLRITLDQSAELTAALKIAELHAPEDFDKEMVPHYCCIACEATGDVWPCDTAKALLDCYVPGWRE
jgi:hypothetical protein